MIKSITSIFGILLIMHCSFSYGQFVNYSYKRELNGVSDQWHKIVLPDEVFGKISKELTDIRIFGITENKDTIEAPYLLRLLADEMSSKDVLFKTLNTSHSDKGYYFTFEIPTIESINQIKLDFKQKNFDWQIKLEGSQNQSDWFTIIDNYRILSINNDITNFQFNKLIFPSSKYRYFRLLINSKQKPDLASAIITQHNITEGAYRNYTLRKFEVSENTETKQTEINIDLQMPVPISLLKIDIKDSFDYYRPVTIRYLSDSFKTELGWKYNYSTLATGTLNSIEKTAFKFSNTIVQKLKVVIYNQDNKPLTIDTLHLRGNVHELIARFTDKATYFLSYGNKIATKPNYDIDRFTDKFPTTLKALELGSELSIKKEDIQETEPLFKNKIWLWIIMGILILVLGWFTFRMMRKEE